MHSRKDERLNQRRGGEILKKNIAIVNLNLEEGLILAFSKTGLIIRAEVPDFQKFRKKLKASHQTVQVGEMSETVPTF